MCEERAKFVVSFDSKVFRFLFYSGMYYMLRLNASYYIWHWTISLYLIVHMLGKSNKVQKQFFGNYS